MNERLANLLADIAASWRAYGYSEAQTLEACRRAEKEWNRIHCR